MNNLTDLQDKFQCYLMSSDKQIEDLIVGTAKVPVETRLMIYGNAYRSRLLEVLESSYPILKAYLGDDDFYQLGNEYIDNFPSTFKSIRWFGDQLPDFLHNHHQFCDYPYLSELAKIEWTMTLAFDAADSKVKTIEEMNNLAPDDWENLQIPFHSSVHLLNLHWNAFEIWQNISDDKEPPEPVCLSLPITWVVWRHDLINHYFPASEDEAWAINGILEGYNFGMLCEGLSQWMDDENAVMQAAALLKKWINDGMVSA